MSRVDSKGSQNHNHLGNEAFIMINCKQIVMIFVERIVLNKRKITLLTWLQACLFNTTSEANYLNVIYRFSLCSFVIIMDMFSDG